jgi:hypothetical protein
LWLASDARPPKWPRAGHSARFLLTIYAHCMPGHDQIASQRIEQALRAPNHDPRQAHNNPRGRWGIPSVMRPCHSWTQRDTRGPDAPIQIR